MKKQICILTKSLKDRDYCVAGIDLKNGKWIRLVSSETGDAFPKELLDDENIKELDIIEVNLKKYVPYNLQKENWLIDDEYKIKKLGTITAREIKFFHEVETPDLILGNARNELTVEETQNIENSLVLLKVERLEFDTKLKGDGRYHYKVNFLYNGRKYNLSLTDPKFRKEYVNNIIIPSAMIVVSIPAVPYGENNLFYKFVAKIII